MVHVFLKEFFEKVDFEKNEQTTKKRGKLLSRLRVIALDNCLLGTMIDFSDYDLN